MISGGLARFGRDLPDGSGRRRRCRGAGSRRKALRTIHADHDDKNPRRLGEPQAGDLRPQLQDAAAAGEAIGGASAESRAVVRRTGEGMTLVEAHAFAPGHSRLSLPATGVDPGCAFNLAQVGPAWLALGERWRGGYREFGAWSLPLSLTLPHKGGGDATVFARGTHFVVSTPASFITFAHFLPSVS